MFSINKKNLIRMLLAALFNIKVEKRLALSIHDHDELINPNAIVIDGKINEEEELEHLNLSTHIKKRIHNGHNEQEPEGIPLLFIALFTTKILKASNQSNNENGSIAENTRLHKDKK